MKLLTGISIALIITLWFTIIIMTNKKINLEEQNAKLRRERNMYDSLYRAANTRLMHFQDSINCHCICK